jgi:hypothetical protein
LKSITTKEVKQSAGTRRKHIYASTSSINGTPSTPATALSSDRTRSRRMPGGPQYLQPCHAEAGATRTAQFQQHTLAHSCKLPSACHSPSFNETLAEEHAGTCHAPRGVRKNAHQALASPRTHVCISTLPVIAASGGKTATEKPMAAAIPCQGHGAQS